MLITAKELCQELRISYNTLVRIVARGELSYLRIGSSMRFRREDVDLYLERSKVRDQVPAPKEKSWEIKAPPPSGRRREARDSFDLEAYKKAGVYVPGRPYFKGMKVVIPLPEENSPPASPVPIPGARGPHWGRACVNLPFQGRQTPPSGRKEV